ncbi:MAG: hypothetical protein JXQ83_12625 [Candidatus Glassbacteria bacterium]|nr:hypothetical protein [Candidatus Glassbacteria bacterium]
MKSKRAGQARPAVLDRVVEVMRHFHCTEPRDLEYLLGLRADTLAGLSRERTDRLPPEVSEAMQAAGVRREFLRQGTGTMLSDSIDPGRLEVMKRHAAIMLQLLAKADLVLSRAERQSVTPLLVAEGRSDPVAVEEELINLLIEALKDSGSRERLIKFIRADIANRTSAMK